MLLELNVQNLLFAKLARIEPGQGLTVISGETGSGKSLLLGALQLVLGGRASSKLVGNAGDATLVTGVFEDNSAVHDKIVALANKHGFSIAEEEPIILRRQLSVKGRSQSWINDTPVGVQVLKEVGHALVDVQGQHEPLRLSERERQMEVLDTYVGIEEQQQAYQQALTRMRMLKQELEELKSLDGRRSKEHEFNKFLLDEIEALEPRAGEYEELSAQQELLAGAEEWRSVVERTAHILSESDDAVSVQVGSLAQELQRAPDDRIRDIGLVCQQAEELMRDAAMQALQVSETLHGDPQALAACEERLGQYVDLMRKHGGTPQALLQSHSDLTAAVARWDNSEARQEALQQEIDELATQALKLGKAVAKQRRTGFKRLSEAIRPHLDDLGMPEAKIELRESQDVKLDLLGICQQEIFVQTNPGIAADRIGAVASGGEHARLALALALVLGDSDQVPVMVFDEIDSGVGARLGVAIGHKLAILAKSRTVIVITHTPQVAAMAHNHYLVRKIQSDKDTHMDVVQLVGEERHHELTEMLGGGKAAAQQAQELLALA